MLRRKGKEGRQSNPQRISPATSKWHEGNKYRTKYRAKYKTTHETKYRETKGDKVDPEKITCPMKRLRRKHFNCDFTSVSSGQHAPSYERVAISQALSRPGCHQNTLKVLES